MFPIFMGDITRHFKNIGGLMGYCVVWKNNTIRNLVAMLFKRIIFYININNLVAMLFVKIVLLVIHKKNILLNS